MNADVVLAIVAGVRDGALLDVQRLYPRHSLEVSRGERSAQELISHGLPLVPLRD